MRGEWPLMLDWLRLIFDFAELRTLFGVDAVVYAILAIAGTALFLLRLGVGLIFGAGDDFDIDMDMAEADGGFGLVSILSITAFLMGAGWMGLVSEVEWELADGWSALLSVLFGFTMMMLASSLMFWMRRMSHEPKADRRTAVGKTATVYMTIPAGGTGKVRVNVSGQVVLVDARSAVERDLPSFTDVKVIAIRDDGVLLVEPAGKSSSAQSSTSDAGEML